MKTYASSQMVLWLLLIATTLTSCDVDYNDYISKYCPGSCTVIKGHVSNQNGMPVSGATLRVQWSDRLGLGSSETHHKAVATTDADGNYELRFLLRDAELERGAIEIITDCEQEKYLSCLGYSSWGSYALSRDTTIIQNYTITPSASLTLNLTREEPSQPDASYSATIKYKLAESDIDSCTTVADMSWQYKSRYTVPANKPVVVQVEKRENGIVSRQKVILVLDQSESREHEIKF